MKLSRILCAVDYSASSRQALDLALELARGRATLELCHVQGGEPDRGDADLEEWRRLAIDVVPAVTSHALEAGDVWDRIAESATRLSADLVVIGAGRRERSLLGTVAERIVRHAPCSVLVVDGAPRGAARPPQRILCAVDFSDTARTAMEAAADLAAERDATLTLVHALASAGEMAVPGLAAGAELAVELRHSAAAALRDWTAEAQTRAGRAVGHHVVEGPPAEAILTIARDDGHDLIVTGTHSRTGLTRALLGSVAEHIVREADRPVLVVR